MQYKYPFLMVEKGGNFLKTANLKRKQLNHNYENSK